MKIILAPDSFKESLTSDLVCQALEKGIRKVFNTAAIVSVPMADGGEGTVQCLVRATGGKILNAVVHDPLMRPVQAYYGILGDGKTAVIEIAAASGLHLLNAQERDPRSTTTYGTGELIRQALDIGCTRIIIGLGGSATNDGGAGMLNALGVRFLDAQQEEIPFGCSGLQMLTAIDSRLLDPRIKTATIIAACDVSNLLYGAAGASYIYAPQKGAAPGMLPELDANLRNYGHLLQQHTGIDIANIPGAGAAGGSGAGLMALLNAGLKPGFPLIAELSGLDGLIKDADWVVTGEGKTDRQTLNGKVPFGVGLLGKKYQVPVLLFSGMLGKGAEDLYQSGITSMFSICKGPVTLDESLMFAAPLLEDAAERVFRIIEARCQ